MARMKIATYRRAPVLAFALAVGLGSCTTTETVSVSDPADPSHFGEGGFEQQGSRKPTIQTMQAMARIASSQGNDTQAELIYDRLIGEHPHYVTAYAEMSELYLRNSMLDSAIAVLSAGLEEHPDDVVLINDLGMCYLFTERYPQALEQFALASAEAPDDARPRANMAVALGFMGRMDEAESIYLQIMHTADAYDNMETLSELTGYPWERPQPVVLIEEEVVEEPASEDYDES